MALGNYSPSGQVIGRSDPYATRKVTEQTSQCRSFVVPKGQEVQFNVMAFMYYKGKRITKLVDSYRKELHSKITQELHAMNLALADTDNYVFVSICSPKARNGK